MSLCLANTFSTNLSLTFEDHNLTFCYNESKTEIDGERQKTLSTHRVQTLRIFCMNVFSWLMNKVVVVVGTLLTTKEQECRSVEALRLAHVKFHYFLQSSSLLWN